MNKRKGFIIMHRDFLEHTPGEVIPEYVAELLAMPNKYDEKIDY